MTSISIIGSGKMSAAIAEVAKRAGWDTQILRRSTLSSSGDRPEVTYGAIGDDLTGDLVIFAVPFVAYPSILEQYRGRLTGSGMRAVDVGPLTRARELEAMEFLQIMLSALGKTRQESGFALLELGEPTPVGPLPSDEPGSGPTRLSSTKGTTATRTSPFSCTSDYPSISVMIRFPSASIRA